MELVAEIGLAVPKTKDERVRYNYKNENKSNIICSQRFNDSVIQTSQSNCCVTFSFIGERSTVCMDSDTTIDEI